MAFEISKLAAKINPRQTVLLLGAGASIPSGAPSGARMAAKLGSNLGMSDVSGYSLSEVCSIFEQRLGRRELAEAVALQLRSVRPTGGLLLLPKFDWYRIYSTNFDTLVETVYAEGGFDLDVRRSNFDFSRDSERDAVQYFKIHGCMTQDVGFGHQTRMLLTEEDYENYSDFRQASFRALGADLVTKDVLVVGQSLADEHLRALIRETLKLRATVGTPSRVFVVSFERDEDRASLLQSRGAEVYFGDLDALLDNLLQALPVEETRESQSDSDFNPTLLPSELVSVSTDVRHAVSLVADVRKVFNGSSATYADIATGYTFERSLKRSVISELQARPIVAILGTGGVGKTTLARQVLTEIGNGADAAWEHNNFFPLKAEYWIEYEERMRRNRQNAVLFVDDCVENLSQVSAIADHLGQTTDPSLRLS